MKCIIIFQILLIFGIVNSFVPLISENIASLQKNRNISRQCFEQLATLDAQTRLLLVDSSMKSPSGIFGGNFWDLGNFDECYNIESTVNNETVYGKYCQITVPIPVPELSVDRREATILTTAFRAKPIRYYSQIQGVPIVEFQGSVCLPHKCTQEDISSIPSIKTNYCYSKSTTVQFTTGAIITIIVLAIFLLIATFSTIFDIYLKYTETKPPHDLVLAFSLLSNGKKLFISTTNTDHLSCLNGLRAISMMWVIYGHTYNIVLSGAILNFFYINQFIHDQSNMFILNATLSVDTFFTIGGAVTVYVFLKSMDKRVKFNVLTYYLHRYLRLTPALGICILVYANLLRYLGDGPLWGRTDAELSEDCWNDWWGSLFYIVNFTHSTCVPQSWYLSIDMQLFLLSPLILLPLRKSEKYGVILLSILCIFGVIIPFAIGYVYELNASFIIDKNTYMIYYYKETHTRFGPYVIGMLLGYMLYKIKKGDWRVSLKPIHIYGLWLISISGLLACIYAPFDTLQTYNRLRHSLILGFQRPAWSLGVSIVIYLCVCGYGGVVDKFLSLPIFQFLSKLSYSMYLIHYAVISLQFYRMREPVYLSNYDAMFMFWGNFMLTVLLSIVLCLIFEAPIIILEKYAFRRAKTEEKPTKSII